MTTLNICMQTRSGISNVTIGINIYAYNCKIPCSPDQVAKRSSVIVIVIVVNIYQRLKLSKRSAVDSPGPQFQRNTSVRLQDNGIKALISAQL